MLAYQYITLIPTSPKHSARTPFMRQSVAPNRVSQTSNPSPAAHARLLEKKKEFYAVSALEKASALYLERMEGLRDDCDIMANAGEGWSAF